MRKVFNDIEPEEEITANGYAIVRQLLNADEVTALAECCNTYTADAGTFTISSWKNTDENKTKIQQQIISTLIPHANKLLADYVPCQGVFTVKRPGAGSDFLLHQDWSLVDEKKFRSVSIWVALVDMDYNNGNLQVIKGSHLIANAPRGRNMDVPFSEIEDYLKQECLTDLPLKVGDAIIFEHRLIHCSPTNNTDKPRIAAVLALMPREADFIHHFYNPDNPNQLEVLNMDRERFHLIDFFNYPAKPENTGVKEIIPYTFRPLRKEDFEITIPAVK